MSSYDVVVIGGGIVGTSAAECLTRSGANTLLIDRHDIGRATDAGAGIIDDPDCTRLQTPWDTFTSHAIGYYADLTGRLSPDEIGYAQCGEMLVACDDKERHQYNDIKAYLEREGVAGRWQVLSGQEAKTRCPILGDIDEAIFYPFAARVDGRKLTHAMHLVGEAYGMSVQRSSVTRLLVDDGHVRGIVVDNERILADKFIIAGGAWSGAFGEQLGVQLPIEPMRGQIIHLDLPDTDSREWAMVAGFRHHYIVCWDNGHIAIGATRERGSGFEPQTTAAGMAEVLNEGLRVAPALAKATFQEIRVGLRPVTADGLPIVGIIPTVDNLFVAAGHGAVGLQLGPYSGKLAADWAVGNPMPMDMGFLSAARF